MIYNSFPGFTALLYVTHPIKTHTVVSNMGMISILIKTFQYVYRLVATIIAGVCGKTPVGRGWGKKLGRHKLPKIA